MTLLASTTSARTLAQQNLTANIEALGSTQPELRQWVEEQHLNVEWVFARDRSLTALDDTGQWLGGCSLPKRAASAMLTRLNVKGAVACFLLPANAAQLEIALDLLRLEQAIVAVVPEMHDLAAMLHCHDFSDAIRSHRLWFAAGPAWDANLQSLLENQIGLATPSQFIRMPDADPQQIEQLISTAQNIFSDINSSRSAAIQSLRREPIAIAQGKTQLLVVAPSRFRLWNNVGEAMIDALERDENLGVTRFDADDPAHSSPLALMKAGRECSAVLTANTARADLPGLLPENMPWITWVTCARIPSSALAGVDDHLILVDSALRDQAIKAGWLESRIHVGTWPKTQDLSRESEREKSLAIIADTLSLDTPPDLAEYSSHSILWEAIRHELSQNPFVLSDVGTYLSERMRKFDIGDESFSHARFIEKLIIPAYQQGVARSLIRAKLPVRLYGQGWSSITEFKMRFAGLIGSQPEFQSAVARSTALVHAWPSELAHPIDGVRTPVVRAAGRNAKAFLAEAQAALSGAARQRSNQDPTLSSELLQRILQTTMK